MYKKKSRELRLFLMVYVTTTSPLQNQHPQRCRLRRCQIDYRREVQR